MAAKPSDLEKLLGQSAGIIVETAEKMLKTLTELPEYDNDRAGGYFTIKRKLAEELLLCCRIGIIPHQDDANPAYSTKACKYLHCSQEKAIRLIAMAYKHNHVSSFQSRNEDNDEFGGAVRCDKCAKIAVSFSGLPELADEALCLALSIYFGWMTKEQADEIAAISSNPYFAPLDEAWKKAA